MSFDRTNAADLASLKAEVNDDANGVGYTAANGTTQVILDLLNLPANNPVVTDEVGVPFSEFAMWEVLGYRKNKRPFLGHCTLSNRSTAG